MTNEINNKEEQLIPKEIESILNDANIPEEKKQKLENFLGLFVSASSFSGPLPPPEILKSYNDIVQNAAERLFKMTERQLEHKMQIENNVMQLEKDKLQIEEYSIKEQHKQNKRGQTFAFSIAMLGLGLSGTLAYLGLETLAGILGSTTIVGLVAIFLNAKKELKNNKNTSPQ